MFIGCDRYAKHGCDEKILNSVQTQIVDMYAKEGVANPLATPTHDATDSTGTPQRDTADKASAAPVETSASNANKASTSSNGAAGNTSGGGSLKRSAERAAGDESTARPLKQRSHSPPSQQGSNGNTSAAAAAAAATDSTAATATATDVAATTATQPGHESEAKETRDETPTSAAADDDNTPRYTGAAAKAVHVAQSVAQAAARAVPDNNSASPSNHGTLTAAQGVALGGASQRNAADPSVMALLDDELNALKHDTPPHNKRTAALSVPARTRLERARSPGLNVRSNPY